VIFPSQVDRVKAFRLMETPSDLMELLAITRWIWHEDKRPDPNALYEQDNHYARIKHYYIQRIIPLIESTDTFMGENPDDRITLHRLITFSSLASEFTPEYASKHFLEIKLKGIPSDWNGADSSY